MINFGVSGACLSVLGAIFFIREIVKIALILVPAGLALMMTIDFFRGTIGNYNTGKDAEVNKIPSIVVRRIVYTVVIFLIPISIYGVLRIIGLKDQVNKSESCWTYLDSKSVEQVKKEVENKEKTNKLIEEISKDSGVNSSNKSQIKTIVSK